MELSERLAELFLKHIWSELSVDERLELEQWRNDSRENRRLFAIYTKPDKLKELIREIESRKKQSWNLLRERIPELDERNPLEGMEEREAERIAYLISGYIHESLTEKERDELDDWVVHNEGNVKLFEELTDENNLEKINQWVASYHSLHPTPETISTKKPRTKYRTLFAWAIAAAVAAVLLIIIFEYINRNK